jgi:hypothetical protein
MGFLDGIIGFLGGAESAILSVLVQLFKLVIAIFQFIWQAILIVVNYLLSAFKAVANFFSHVWSNFFKGIFTHLYNGIVKVTQWLESHLRPIIQFLQKVQKYIDKIYKTYIAPVLKMIQRIRQFLSILRLLHVQWAIKLDAILSKVQTDIQRVFLEIRGILTTAIDLLNIVADPLRLLRKPTLILSLRRTIHALIRSVTGLPPGFFFPSPRKGAPKGLGFLPLNFDARNPDHNPPASYYLGLDYGVPGLDGHDPTVPVPDEFINSMERIDYFDDDAWPLSPCIDVEACVKLAHSQAFQWE